MKHVSVAVEITTHGAYCAPREDKTPANCCKMLSLDTQDRYVCELYRDPNGDPTLLWARNRHPLRYLACQMAEFMYAEVLSRAEKWEEMEADRLEAEAKAKEDA